MFFVPISTISMGFFKIFLNFPYKIFVHMYGNPLSFVLTLIYLPNRISGLETFDLDNSFFISTMLKKMYSSTFLILKFILTIIIQCLLELACMLINIILCATAILLSGLRLVNVK